MADPATLRLLSWLSPAFPTGGFAYSHGVEWAVESGDIKNGPTLQSWLETLLRHGTGRSDAILCRHAHRAANNPPPPFQESKFEVKPRCIQFHINKKEGDVWWPRLLKDKVKEKNQVQVDWSRYVDEDEAEGKGFGDMQFGGGAQGFGGEDFDGMG